jgi:hypothetical protein
VPDEAFTMLTLPGETSPKSGATIHTVVNALEATALGAANLTGGELPLEISVNGGGNAAPRITVRVGRFFKTSNARYVVDALLADDCPQVIPAGESKLIWLEAESRGAKPGRYDFEVDVQVGEDRHRVPLQVQVHDVVLSEETPLSTGNWSYLAPGDLEREVRDSMLSHRLTVGMSSVQGLPKKDADGKLIRPLEIDFSSMDTFLAFHEDFEQVGWYFPFDPHTGRPHRDWFGPAEWMSDEFKEIFGEWLLKVVEHIRSKGRDYDQFYFLQNYFPLVYPIAPGYPRPPPDIRTAERVVPSRRWQHVRMGIEDYMLLKMARERIAVLGDSGRTYQGRLDEIIRTVLTNRDRDRALFRAKRRELVELLESVP